MQSCVDVCTRPKVLLLFCWANEFSNRTALAGAARNPEVARQWLRDALGCETKTESCCDDCAAEAAARGHRRDDALLLLEWGLFERKYA